MMRRGTREILYKIGCCKAEGICARDKLMTKWVNLRIDRNDELFHKLMDEFDPGEKDRKPCD